jgi:predicted transcriptional regulator
MLNRCIINNTIKRCFKKGKTIMVAKRFLYMHYGITVTENVLKKRMLNLYQKAYEKGDTKTRFQRRKKVRD